MDALVTVWLCAATVLSGIGASAMLHMCYTRHDDTPSRARRIRFMSFFVGWLWIMLGLTVTSRLVA